jgi:hypothetical protein
MIASLPAPPDSVIPAAAEDGVGGGIAGDRVGRGIVGLQVDVDAADRGIAIAVRQLCIELQVQRRAGRGFRVKDVVDREGLAASIVDFDPVVVGFPGKGERVTFIETADRPGTIAIDRNVVVRALLQDRRAVHDHQADDRNRRLGREICIGRLIRLGAVQSDGGQHDPDGGGAAALDLGHGEPGIVDQEMIVEHEAVLFVQAVFLIGRAGDVRGEIDPNAFR